MREKEGQKHIQAKRARKVRQAGCLVAWLQVRGDKERSAAMAVLENSGDNCTVLTPR